MMKMNARASGFTLVEVLVVTVIGALLMAGVYQTLVVQQQSFRQQRSIASSRQTSRTTLDVLSMELREVSASGDDVLFASSDSIQVRVYRKTAIICALGGLVTNVHVWQLGEAIVGGERALIFADGDTASTSDDSWSERGIDAVTSGTVCPADWNGYSQASLAITSGVVGVQVGAPVRIYETLTYGNYHLDGDWVFGRRAANATAPVALIGPIAAPEQNGLRFSFFDDKGNTLHDIDVADASGRRKIARIEILVRGRAMGAAKPGEAVVDSLVTQINLRGNDQM